MMIESIMNTPNMIRSQRKIEAVINNARQFKKIQEEFGTFDQYLWGYSNYKTIIYQEHSKSGIPARNELSDIISKDLKKRGFKYLGSITVYAHLQSCGIINDHITSCFCYEQTISHHPVIYQKE